MRILAIGDPHGELEKVKKIPIKDTDLILLTGDLGSSNLMRKMYFDNIERKKKGLAPIVYSPKQEKTAFMEAYDTTIKIVGYLSKQAPVMTIFGNVESSNAQTREKAKEIGLPLPFLYDQLRKIKGVRVINNQLSNFHGIRIGGLEYFLDTSWVKEFHPQNYKEKLSDAKFETDKARRILRRFGTTDILLCHQPPYGVLDKVIAKYAPKHWQGKHAGSKAVLDYISRYQPRYVLCGHMHETKGEQKIGKTEVHNLGVAGYKVIEL